MAIYVVYKKNVDLLLFFTCVVNGLFWLTKMDSHWSNRIKKSATPIGDMFYSELFFTYVTHGYILKKGLVILINLFFYYIYRLIYFFQWQ